ncbi:MAG: TonB-dependent receptor [Bacteroidota bacterium]|nr:TonB-dependent receptor [Bacteroidota bacterium]
MKRILTIASILLSINLFAQESTVTGFVLDPDTREGEIGAILQFYDDAHEKPIAFTTVAADGSFSQRLSGRGDFLVVISNLGRKDLERRFIIETPGETVDLGTMLMVTDAQQLEAASVTAQKVLVKMDVDKMTYNVSEDNDAKASTVLDMLRKVPMVTVDGQDNITVNGSSSFLVTVDGKPNQMMTQNAKTVFKMMPASSVEKIEVITNPGVKYDAEGVGGVLNLTTPKGAGGSNIADGQYGSARLYAGTREQGLGGMYTVQKGKLSFSIDVNAGYMTQKGMEMETTTKTGATGIHTYAINDIKSPVVMGDLSLSYEIDSLNLVSATAGVMRFGIRQDGTTSVGLLGAEDWLYTGETGMKQPQNSYNASVDWQHNFANRPGRMLTLSYRLNTSPSSVESYNYYTPEAAMPSRKMEGTTHSSEQTLQADFTLPLGEKAGTLSTGLKYIHRNNSAAQDLYLRTYPSEEFLYDLGGSTDYKYRNRIGAAYAEYSGSFGKWGVKAGGRYEHTWQSVEYEQGTTPDFSLNYGVFVPMASLQYNLGMMQNIGLSYNMRISRPGITYLNPYVDQNDPTHWTYGNPNLDVEKTHNMSLVYNFYNQAFMFNATLTHSRGKGGIGEYTFTEDGVLKTTYGNLLDNNNTGLSLFANVNIGKKARLFANGGVTYSDMRNDELGLKNHGWSGNVMMGSQQTIFWDLQLSENFIWMGRRNNLQGYQSGISGIALAGITKTFLDDRLSISLQGLMPMTRSGKIEVEVMSRDRNYEMYTTARVPIREVILSLNWTFGKAGTSVKKTARTISNDDLIEHSSSTSTASGMGSGMGM